MMIQQFVVNGLIFGAAYSLISVGFLIVYQTTRFFSAFVRRWRTPADTQFARLMLSND